MDVGCEICIHQHVCSKTLKECRQFGGGREDPELLLKKLQEENERLKAIIRNLPRVKNNADIEFDLVCRHFEEGGS